MKSLKNNIQQKNATIGIIGLGYVGLPLSIRFSEEGFKVTGFDIDKEKVDLLNSGKSYIKHIKEGAISAMSNNGFTATADFSEIANVDAIIICVPTPLGVHNEPDLSYIHGTLEHIKPHLKENQLLILESTTYPGTTEEILVPFVESIPDSSPITHYASPSIYEEDTISLSDILLTLAEQLKVIVLVPFITVFLTFTYVQFIQQPQYVSWATVLLPSGGGANLGGLAGLASQFGVNLPTGAQADLSNPSLFPELLRSRTFAEKILDKKFYTKEFGKELSLLAILTHGNDPPKVGRDTLVTSALGALNGMLEFNQDPSGSFSVIRAIANEPIFAKELAEVTLAELEALNRFYKSQTVNEKTSFIANRIASVENDLESSETRLKEFNEKNRQISSPALQLEQDRLARDVEIQKGIYLTLKQQFELAKIEEIQGASVVQVLDKPQIALGPSNKKLKLNVLLAGVLGFGLGIMLGFVRSYVDSNDMDERKKLRRMKHFMKKKTKDIFLDRRVSGIVSVLLLIGLPIYLSYESKNPIFFGMYSTKLMIVNTVYVLVLLSSLTLFIYLFRKRN